MLVFSAMSLPLTTHQLIKVQANRDVPGRAGYCTEKPRKASVLATWVISSENSHYENSIPSLNPLQTQLSKGKIGSRHSILMNE